MISVIRAADGSIKTFSEKPDYDFTFTLGETLELVDASFTEYASRFKLSCNGKSGETLTVMQGSPDLAVRVSCPGQESVEVNINGSLEKVDLLDGEGHLILSTEVAGIFLLRPGDTRVYCPGGESSLCIEVVPRG